MRGPSTRCGDGLPRPPRLDRSRPHRLTRLSRFVLTLALVPLLVIASPAVGPAAAAVQTSGNTSTVVQGGTGLAGMWWRFKVTGWYVAEGTASDFTTKVRGGGVFEAGTGYKINKHLGSNMGDFSVRMVFSDTNGGTFCRSTVEGRTDSSGTVTATSGNVMLTPVSGSCEVNQVCVTITKTVSWAPDVYEHKCQAFNMGPVQPPASGPTCSMGVFPVAVSVNVVKTMPTISTNYDYTLTTTIRWSGSPVQGAVFELQWIANGQSLAYKWANNVRIQRAVISEPSGTVVHTQTVNEPSSTNQAQAIRDAIKGVQVFSNRGTSVQDFPYTSGGDGTTLNRQALTADNFWRASGGHRAPQTNNWEGVTARPYCTAWFGPNVRAGLPGYPLDANDDQYNKSAGALDEDPDQDPAIEPFGPGDETPPEEGCTFVATDPSTWLEAGMCAAVGVLMAIWDVLKEAVAALLALAEALWEAIQWLAGELIDALGALDDWVDALLGWIKDALEWAFKPDTASWGLGGLVDQAKEKPPFSVLDAGGDMLESFQAGYSSSACGNLPSFEIGATSAAVDCSTFRSIGGVNGLISLVVVGLYALTGVGILKLVASSFGGKGA